MPSKRGLGLALVVAVLAFAGLFALSSAPVATAQSTVNISIKNFSFNPSNITVVIGVNNTVTWTNNDGVTHTVTANDNSFGGSLTPGSTFTHTFTAAGTFSYHCSIHNYMKGAVVVLSASSSSTTSASSTTSVSSSSSSSSSSSTLATSSSSTSSSTTTAPPTSTQSATTQSSSVSSTASSSTQSTSSSTGQVGAVPEFPFAAAGIFALAAILAIAYLASRKVIGARNTLAA